MAIVKRCWIILLLIGCLYSIVFVTTVSKYMIFVVSDVYIPLVQDGSFSMKNLLEIDDSTDATLKDLRGSLQRHKDLQPILGHVFYLSASLRNQIPVMNWELERAYRQFIVMNDMSSDLLNLLDQYDQFGIQSLSNIEGGDGLESLQHNLNDLERIQKICGRLEGLLIHIDEQHDEVARFSLITAYSRGFASSNLVKIDEFGSVALEVCQLGAIIASTLPLINYYQSWVSTIQDADAGSLYIPHSLNEDLYLMNQKSLLIKNQVAKIRSLSGASHLPAGMLALMEVGSDGFYSATNLLENMQPQIKEVSTLEESSLVKMNIILEELKNNESLISDTLANLNELIDRVADHENLSKLEFMGHGIIEMQDMVRVIDNLNVLANNYHHIFGIGTPTKYLILGHSSDELRATGGFISAIWLVTIEDAEIMELTYYDVASVDNLEKLDQYPSPPRDLEEHMGAWVWLMRDVSWNPDFKSTSENAMRMFLLSNDIDVDGVIAVNQLALLSLSKALSNNPDRDNISELDYATLMSRLESGTDQQGRSFVHVVMEEILDEVLQLNDVDVIKDLLNAFHNILKSKDIMVYMEDVKIQEILEDLNWGGRVDPPSGDYLFVIDSNVGWSKSDRNVQRGIEYILDFRQIDSPIASLTLTYHNHSGKGAAPCEPQWIRRGNSYTEQLNQCYWNFFRIYTPRGSNVIQLPNLPLPRYSFSAVKGTGSPGNNTARVVTEYGLSVMSGLAIVGNGERERLDFKYRLPNKILSKNGSCYAYDLQVGKQPGVRSRHMTIEFLLPTGYGIRNDLSGQVTEVNPSRYEVELNSEQHYIFNICDNEK